MNQKMVVLAVATVFVASGCAVVGPVFGVSASPASEAIPEMHTRVEAVIAETPGVVAMRELASNSRTCPVLGGNFIIHDIGYRVVLEPNHSSTSYAAYLQEELSKAGLTRYGGIQSAAMADEDVEGIVRVIANTACVNDKDGYVMLDEPERTQKRVLAGVEKTVHTLERAIGEPVAYRMPNQARVIPCADGKESYGWQLTLNLRDTDPEVALQALYDAWLESYLATNPSQAPPRPPTRSPGSVEWDFSPYSGIGAVYRLSVAGSNQIRYFATSRCVAVDGSGGSGWF